MLQSIVRRKEFGVVLMNAWLCPVLRGCCNSKMHFWDVRIYVRMFLFQSILIFLIAHGLKYAWIVRENFLWKDELKFEKIKILLFCLIFLNTVKHAISWYCWLEVVLRWAMRSIGPCFLFTFLKNSIGKLWPHLIELFSED